MQVASVDYPSIHAILHLSDKCENFIRFCFTKSFLDTHQEIMQKPRLTQLLPVLLFISILSSALQQ